MDSKKTLTFDTVKGAAFRRYQPVAFALDGKGYYGLNAFNISFNTSENASGAELWEYDASADSWRKKTSMPVDWATGGANVYGVISGKLHMTYRESTTNYGKGNILLYDYNLMSGEWSRTIGKITRANEWAGILNDKIYVGPSRDRRYTTPRQQAYFMLTILNLISGLKSNKDPLMIDRQTLLL